MILRVFVLIPIGYLAACLAAAWAHTGLSPEIFGSYAGGGIFVLLATTYVLVSFVPSLIAIVLAELFSLRSILIWLPLGATIAIWGVALSFLSERNDEPLLVGAIVQGAFGGAVYWLIAGRRSGPRRDMPGS
jgi:hypothetical protein